MNELNNVFPFEYEPMFGISELLFLSFVLRGGPDCPVGVCCLAIYRADVTIIWTMTMFESN